MVNQRSVKKVLFRMWVTRELHAKLKKLGAEKGMTAPDIVIPLLERATAKVTLTEEDHKEIEKAIAAKSPKTKTKGKK